MEWKSRNGISLICLICFIIFLLIAIWFGNNKLESQSQIAFILAEATISIPITLILIEWVIGKDREKQWEKVKSVTYMSILEHVTIIARSASMHSHLEMKGEALEFAQILENGFINPKEEVSIAIIELARISKKETKNWISFMMKEADAESRKKFSQSESQSLGFFYEDAKWRLDEMRHILIPRVLQLSDDKEVNLALLRFEKFCRRFNEFMKTQTVLNEIPSASNAMPKFLIELGIIYDVILKEIPTSDREGIVYFSWPFGD